MKKKNNIWIYGLIGGILIFGLIFGIVSINSKDKNIGIQDSSNLNSNVSTEVTEPTLSETPTEPPKSIVESVKDIVSTDFKGDLKSVLPTIEDFNVGFEIISNKAKTIDDFATEDKERAIVNGFIEGWERRFQKGSASLYDLDNYEIVYIDISIYPKDNILNVYNYVQEKVDSGILKQKTMVDYEEYDEELEDWVTKQKEEEKTFVLGQLKDPQIGDKSILWSQQEKDTMFKMYTVTFIKNNVRVAVGCFSSDSQKAIDNCINWAEFVEKKI